MLTKEVEKALQEHSNKQASREAGKFKKIYEEIKALKDSNEQKGYKAGKLYFDLLKKFQISEIHHNELVHAAYRVLVKNDDYNEIEKMLLDRASNQYSPEQLFSEISLDFLNFTKKLSQETKKAIPSEKLKEVLETSYKKHSLKELDSIKNLIIENNAKELILDALNWATTPWGGNVPESKIEELKLKVEKSFS